MKENRNQLAKCVCEKIAIPMKLKRKLVSEQRDWLLTELLSLINAFMGLACTYLLYMVATAQLKVDFHVVLECDKELSIHTNSHRTFSLDCHWQVGFLDWHSI